MESATHSFRESQNETVKSSRLQGENVFNAFKTYKEQDQQLHNIANRIKKLQLNEIKNMQKAQNHQRLLSSLQKIRQDREEEIRKLSQHKEIIRSQIIAQQEKNVKDKSMNKLSIQNVFSDIKNKRLQGYDWMKQKRLQNEQRVIKIKELDLEEKKRVRDMIKGDEKIMRESRMIKLKLKKENVDRGNQQDIIDLKERGKVQKEQIKKLERVQTEMIERHSQSKAKTLFVRQRSDLLIKSQKSSLSELTKKESIQNVYVHPLVKRIQKRIDKYHILNQR